MAHRSAVAGENAVSRHRDSRLERADESRPDHRAGIHRDASGQRHEMEARSGSAASRAGATDAPDAGSGNQKSKRKITVEFTEVSHAKAVHRARRGHAPERRRMQKLIDV